LFVRVIFSSVRSFKVLVLRRFPSAIEIDHCLPFLPLQTDDTRGAVREKAHDAKEGAKDVGRWAGHKAHDAADTAKSTYRSAADSTSRAANKAEDKVAAAGNAALGTASSVEEKTGQFMKKGGEGLEKDGRESKDYFRGKQMKEETKSRWGCSIM